MISLDIFKLINAGSETRQQARKGYWEANSKGVCGNPG